MVSSVSQSQHRFKVEGKYTWAHIPGGMAIILLEWGLSFQQLFILQRSSLLILIIVYYYFNRTEIREVKKYAQQVASVSGDPGIQTQAVVLTLEPLPFLIV